MVSYIYLQIDLPVCDMVEPSECDDSFHDGRNCVVNGLEGCTNYTVEMYAYNSAGRSSPEEAENATAVAG